jgi:predicted TIM-barrel fold metal-dependent hydrolase
MKSKDTHAPGCGSEDLQWIGSRGQASVFRQWKRWIEPCRARLGISRREFIKTQMGLAAFFLSMNNVFGPFFAVDESEASEEDAGRERDQRLRGQFIFDVQVHYVHEDYPSPEGLLLLRETSKRWNPRLRKGERQSLEEIQFENFIREVFEQSQTKAAVLSNAPADEPEGWFLTNKEALQARKRVNDRLGKKRLLAHAVFTPGQPGWEDELEKALELKPDAWKGYTLGDPRGGSEYPWRLDDELLVYPAFEKMEKAGIRNICIHKGLLPTGYRKRLTKEQIDSARVDDVGRAAKDWPNLNFIIYHSAIEKVIPGDEDAAEFRKSGRIPWVTELAEIPAKHGVENVYGEIGAVFATTCVAHPELCAGVLGTLVRGLGSDHVCYGTDSVWFGAPQFQIEALRRIEIPERMQRNFGFKPLGPADGPVKKGIFGENSARLYGLNPKDYL